MTDLAVVADRLSRAADLIEHLAVGVDPEGFDADVLVQDEWRSEDAAWIAAFDPRTVAALVPLLHLATGAARSAAEAGGPLADWVVHLHTFARRLLREEETTDD